MSFKALVLDIEGTVTSISFVKEELFPYAYKNVERYLEEHFDEEPIQKIIADMRELSSQHNNKDTEVRLVRNSKEEAIADVAHNVRHWIDIDAKLTAMKALQGCIWEDAYKKGEVKGHVYPDVLPVLEQLKVPIYIYSSGSVYAQKLLFGYSVNGDMTKILSGYFDTNVGLKGDAESYRKIAEQIHQEPSDVLFLSDVEAEVRAASSAGLQTKLVLREGNVPLSEAAQNDFALIQKLDEIL